MEFNEANQFKIKMLNPRQLNVLQLLYNDF